MNRFQRASAGIKGSIENTLDDLRHTWEKVVYGEKITGEVNMFPKENEPSQATNNFYGCEIDASINNFYNYDPPAEPEHDLGQEMER